MLRTAKLLPGTCTEWPCLHFCWKTPKGWILKSEKPQPIQLIMFDILSMLTHRCLLMCLVHDMAESIVGDLTPHCGVSVEEKHRREEEAMEEIVKLVPELAANELRGLFAEYESQNTKEATLVKDLDRFDMICQAYEYEEAKKALSLQEFFDATEGKFKHAEIQAWVAELKNKRALLADGLKSTESAN